MFLSCFFFRQKTAYERRFSDWSSDVCSSDLITRAEGKPEQAIDKIVEGRLNAWYKDQVLLEQPYAKDDKQSITQLLGDATIAGLAQVYLGSCASARRSSGTCSSPPAKPSTELQTPSTTRSQIGKASGRKRK